MDEEAGSEQPRYLLLVCEGPRCVPVASIPAGSDAVARAEESLNDLATQLRERDVIGRLVLLDARTGRRVAGRQLWP